MIGAAEKALETDLFGAYNQHGSEVLNATQAIRYFSIADVWRVLRVLPDGNFWVLWRSPFFNEGGGNQQLVHTWLIDSWDRMLPEGADPGSLMLTTETTGVVSHPSDNWIVQPIRYPVRQATWDRFREEQRHNAAQWAEMDERQIDSALGFTTL